MAIFLRIPGIDGDSLDSAHKGWIDIDDLSHSIDAQASASAGARRTGSGRVARSASAGAFDLRKAVDLSTVKLQEAVVNGKGFAEATIEVTRRTSDSGVVFLRYTLGECFIAQWDLQASETGIAVERFELGFGQLTTTFTPTSAQGREGSPVEFGWDFAANTAL